MHVNDRGGIKPWALAAVAGLVWAAAFPPVTFLPAAWLAPALLLWATFGRPRRAFALGLVAGAAHYFSSLSWLIYIPVQPGNYVGWAALSGYCALYPAMWAAFCWVLYPGDREKTISEGMATLSSRERLGWGATCAAGWVALECLRGWVITGFPWNYLGASQLDFTRLALFAAWTGVLGVSLVVVWCSVGGLLAVLCARSEKKYTPACLRELAAPAGLLVVALLLGSLELNRPLDKERGKLEITLVQPAIPQTVLWDVGNAPAQANRFDQLMDLSERALSKKVDLLVWPEAAQPPWGALDRDHLISRMHTLETKVAESGAWRVWGADTATNRVPFNSAVLLDSNSSVLANPAHADRPLYSKQHLVMFGEYVPLGDVFPFLKSLAPVSNFGRGTGPVVFDLGEARTSVIICFEDVVPAIARRAATPEVDFLLNLTNDGWFGDSHQQWQHARSAAWRAIETRRPLVRCCNNGITGWIDERGKFHLGAKAMPVHSPGIRRVSVPLREGQRTPTFYQRTGDWLPWAAVLAFVLLLGRCWLRRKKDSAEDAEPAK